LILETIDDGFLEIEERIVQGLWVLFLCEIEHVSIESFGSVGIGLRYSLSGDFRREKIVMKSDIKRFVELRAKIYGILEVLMPLGCDD